MVIHTSIKVHKESSCRQKSVVEPYPKPLHIITYFPMIHFSIYLPIYAYVSTGDLFS